MSFIEKGYIEMGCLRDDVFTIWLSRYDSLGFGNNEFKPIFNRYIGIKDKDEYKANFVKFVTRWNELLPDLPLYSNIYHDFFNEKLKNYDTNNLIRISDAL